MRLAFRERLTQRVENGDVLESCVCVHKSDSQDLLAWIDERLQLSNGAESLAHPKLSGQTYFPLWPRLNDQHYGFPERVFEFAILIGGKPSALMLRKATQQHAGF